MERERIKKNRGKTPFGSGKTLRNGEEEKKTFLLSVYEQKGVFPRPPLSPKKL
jgi:hypothetical protein